LPIVDCRLNSIGNGHSAIGIDQLSARKPFLLRIDPQVLEAIQRWANDDLRSLNGQIEFLLRQALVDSGRSRPKDVTAANPQMNTQNPED
jgi:hypothetical protein